MNIKLKIINSTHILIGLILLFVFIFLTINIYQELSSFKNFYDKELTIELIFKIFYYTRSFLHPTIILLALIGFFISRPIGWVLINNLFVYFLVLSCFIVLPIMNAIWYMYLIAVIPISLILLMQTSKNLDFHKIKRENLLTLNLAAIVLGLLFSILYGYFKLNPGLSLQDIISNQ